VGRRIARLRDELLAAHAGETLLLVSHVTPIKMLLRMALDAGPSVLYRMHLGPGVAVRRGVSTRTAGRRCAW